MIELDHSTAELDHSVTKLVNSVAKLVNSVTELVNSTATLYHATTAFCHPTLKTNHYILILNTLFYYGGNNMAHYRNWLPGGRDDQPRMAETWLTVPGVKGAARGVPQSEITELTALAATAEAKLNAAKSSERTAVITAECRTAFDALTGKMRFIKSRRFLSPPLTDADFAALLLSYDGTTTGIPPPAAQPAADVAFSGLRGIELRHIRPVDPSTGDPRSNEGARIYFGLTGEPTETYKFRITGEVKSGRDLPSSQFTKRKKERFDFPAESGNRVYVCMRFEHGGAAGPWGPALSAVIP
jgi:hypothetical protein